MLRHALLVSLLLVLALALPEQLLWGQIPQVLSYQGVLTNPSGSLLSDGDYSMTFKLYPTAQGGAPLWSESQTVVVKNGLFNVALGAVNPLNLLFDNPYWLSITVGEGSESGQRLQLTSSAYSLSARSIADSAVTGSKIAQGQVLRSINTLKDDVTIVAGDNVAIEQKGNSLII